MINTQARNLADVRYLFERHERLEQIPRRKWPRVDLQTTLEFRPQLFALERQLGTAPARGYRVIAIAYLITLAEFIVMHGKHYYLAPAYPMLFAAGGVGVERLFSVRLQWLKPALLAAMIVLAITAIFLGSREYLDRQLMLLSG